MMSESENKAEFLAALKASIKEITRPMIIAHYGNLIHPETVPELVFHIHAIQNILIAEYARHTPLKEELDLF